MLISSFKVIGPATLTQCPGAVPCASENKASLLQNQQKRQNPEYNYQMLTDPNLSRLVDENKGTDMDAHCLSTEYHERGFSALSPSRPLSMAGTMNPIGLTQKKKSVIRRRRGSLDLKMSEAVRSFSSIGHVKMTVS
jgi:hypothetical protein